MVIESITSDFIGSENSSPHYGFHLANYINECNLSGNDLPSKLNNYIINEILFYFIVTVKQFAEATIKSLRNRFPDSPLYYSMRILDPKETPINRDSLGTYGEIEIKMLADFMEKLKEMKVIPCVKLY
jgi:hypothetical protein